MGLMELLPWQVYHGEEHVVDLMRALDIQSEKLQAAKEDLFLQLRPSTATWGLAYHEREYGIQPNESKDRNQRISGWRARRRGRGTTTEALLKSVAESYANGEVLIEVFPEEYRFEITFVSMLGEPPGLEDLKAVIEEIKPAHLGVSYNILYNTHSFLAQFSHRQLARHTHKELREKRIQFNTHRMLMASIHSILAQYTHEQLMMEEL